MSINIFETNDLKNIKIEHFQDSKIYVMDNFYKYPDELIYHLLHVKEPTIWKKEELLSYNGTYFLDARHNFYNQYWETVGIQLAKLCNQSSFNPGMVKTNCIKFRDCQFNNYKDYFWAPHYDFGYTALIYLNSVDTFTNLYECVEEDKWSTPEHFEPWRPKYKYKILKQLQGKFNKLIMFDGSKFLHGMDISSDIFFDVYRLNQVLFFR